MNRKTLLFTLINAFIFVSTIIVTYLTLNYGTVAGQVDTGTSVGWFYIVTFTVESNILLGAIAGVATACGLKSLIDKSDLPRSLTIWYLVAASSAMLTCLTVLLFLAPMRAASGKNYFEMLMGPMFFFHFFNPILAAITLIFLSGNTKLTIKARLLSLIPPILYSIPYILNVTVFKSWPDFYGITFGGQYAFIPLVFAVFCLVVFGISTILAILHNRTVVKSKNPW